MIGIRWMTGGPIRSGVEKSSECCQPSEEHYSNPYTMEEIISRKGRNEYGWILKSMQDQVRADSSDKTIKILGCSHSE
ncbi:hypothetical protein Tco_0677086 [Tanacetum coccineum]